MIRAQIARHAQPRTTPRNHVKLVQKSGIVRDPYVILPFGLGDRALRLVASVLNSFLTHPQSDLEKAEEWFLKAKSLDPEDSSVYQHYGECC